MFWKGSPAQVCNIRNIRFLRHTAQDHLESPLGPVPSGCGNERRNFAAIAIAWLAYLVPHFVRGRDADEELLDDSDPADRFSDSMRIVRHGTAPLLDQDLEEIESFDVSTPQTRRPRSMIFAGWNGLPHRGGAACCSG